MEPRTIVIDPVTRIEGHSKITLRMGESGSVEEALFHVTQFRGFEKFCEGRPFGEMPSLMARTCGICPVSHLIAGAKACDAILAVRVPKTGANLRRVLNLGQIIQSHALSFFHLASPDLLLGHDSDPAKRNIFGVYEANPQLARDGVRLRKFGQQIIERLAGKRIHPAWVVPGGVSEPLTDEKRDQILAEVPEAMAIVRRAFDWYKTSMHRYREEIRTFANFPSMFLGLVSKDDELELYEGRVKVLDGAGHTVNEGFQAPDYAEFIGEYAESFSYCKSAYYKPAGYPDGIYRVGPLARLNLVSRCGTPLADQEWAEFRALDRGAVLSSFHYHHARLVEILFAIEKVKLLLEEDEILSKNVRAFAGPNESEGVGISEAPRGTLIHHYRVDEQGLVTYANLIIATGHNNMAMNRGVLQVERQFVHGEKISEGALNRVEAVIRAFDPCLSCSTHAVGEMPLELELRAGDGTLLDRLRR
jgi:NAD-reducing hydrogenase large subunit